MKSLRILAAIVLFSCCSTSLFAQCGVDAKFGIAPSTVANAYAYKFIDSSKIATGWKVTSRLWTFGDGGTSTLFDPVHQYAAPGNYKVCLVECAEFPTPAGPGKFCCDTTCREISICHNVKAEFTFTVTGNTVVFVGTGSSSAAPLKFSWSFPGGNPSSSSTPTTTVNFPNSGTYQVCLKVVDAHGCYAYVCKNVVVGSNTNACDGIKASFTMKTQQNTIVLEAVAQKAGTLYQWKMDGHKLTYPNPNTSFEIKNVSSGIHKICLYVYAGTTISLLHPCDSICKDINITATNCNVNASWTYTYTSIGGIYFVSVPNVTGVAHRWDFGDGSTSDQANPVHNYAAAGQYKVCHIVSIPGTVCADTFCNVVKTAATSGCHANFKWTLSSANSGPTVAFINQSSSAAGDLINSYEWHFGDGTPASTLKDPIHSYTASGKYYVCLSITTKGGCKSTYCDSVKITINNYCKSYYTWKLTSGANNVVSFTSQPSVAAGDEVVTYYWSFGDGPNSTSSDKNPTHTYSPGKYYTCLKIITKKGCLSYYCDTVKVGSSNIDCHAYFKWNATSASGVVVFTNESKIAVGDSIIKSYWTFGDNTVSDSKSPTHTYNASGKFKVCLTIATKKGCTSTYCDTVKIGINTTNCLANFVYNFQDCNTVKFNNTSTGNYSNVEWKFGDGSFSKEINPHHTFTSPGTYTVVLSISNPLTNCSSTIYKVIVIKPCGNDTICGMVFNDNNGNGKFDAGDTPEDGAEVFITSSNNTSAVVKTDANGRYYAIVPSGDHTVYISGKPGCLFTVPVGNATGTVTGGRYYIPAGKVNHQCNYNFGINCNVVQICGVVFFDANGNGTRENNENGIPNVAVLLKNGNGKEYHTYTNQSGEYCIKVPTGNYTVTIKPALNSTCPTTPSSIHVDATTPGKFYGHNDFAVKCPTASCDLKIQLTPNVSVTPGFPTWYTIFVCNLGTTTTSATVKFHYDAALEYNYSNPAHATADASAREVSWLIPGISPGDCKYFVVHLTTKKNAALGSKVENSAEVIPASSCNDSHPANNRDTAYKVVTGSWDPNNKLAYLTNYNDVRFQEVSSINADQRIEYVINFQNSGTAPAINIVLEDTLSGDLEIDSYEYLGASHPAEVTRNGNAVSYSFTGIYLPAEIDDEPNSHGFVRFAINAKNGLSAGHIISDDAAIYFDFNEAVITNDAAVIMLERTGIHGTTVSTSTVLLAPNPMTDYVRITLSGAQTEGFILKVMDMSGRIVTEQNSLSNTLNLSRNNLSSGMYLYEVIQNNKQVARGKMIVQ